MDPLVAATSPRYRQLVLTLLLACLRIGEALALRWEDLDLLSHPPRIKVSRNPADLAKAAD